MPSQLTAAARGRPANDETHTAALRPTCEDEGGVHGRVLPVAHVRAVEVAGALRARGADQRPAGQSVRRGSVQARVACA